MPKKSASVIINKARIDEPIKKLENVLIDKNKPEKFCRNVVLRSKRSTRSLLEYSLLFQKSYKPTGATDKKFLDFWIIWLTILLWKMLYWKQLKSKKNKPSKAKGILKPWKNDESRTIQEGISFNDTLTNIERISFKFKQLMRKGNINGVLWLLTNNMNNHCQKEPFRGVLRKRCSENMQQIYRRIPVQKCDFNKVANNFIEIKLWHGCSPINLLHIFRTPFPKNTSEGLLLHCIKTKLFR